MNNFETIIAAEKKRNYEIADRDQFVFDTLTSIQAQKSNVQRRLLIIAIALIGTIAVLIQILFLQSASFSHIVEAIQVTLTQKPYYLAIFNLGLIGIILFARRRRHF